MGELSGAGTDLTTSASNFFSSIQNVLNQPESNSVRNLAVQSGETLAGNINQMANQVEQMQAGLNTQNQRPRPAKSISLSIRFSNSTCKSKSFKVVSPPAATPWG